MCYLGTESILSSFRLSQAMGLSQSALQDGLYEVCCLFPESQLLTLELSSHKNAGNLPLSHTEGLLCSSLSPSEFLFVFQCECFAVFCVAKDFQSSKEGINQTSFILNFVSVFFFLFCNNAQLKGLLHVYRVL